MAVVIQRHRHCQLLQWTMFILLKRIGVTRPGISLMYVCMYEIEDYYVGESVGRLDRVELFCVRHHRIIHVPLLSVDRRTSHEYNYYFV